MFQTDYLACQAKFNQFKSIQISSRSLDTLFSVTDVFTKTWDQTAYPRAPSVNIELTEWNPVCEMDH